MCRWNFAQPPSSRHSFAQRLDTPLLRRLDNGVGDYYGRGDCYRHQGKLDEAMAEYSQALQLDPKFAGACWGRGDCLLAQVSATSGCVPAITSDAACSEALPCQSRIQGNFDAGIQEFTAALVADPNYERAYFGRAECLRCKGQLREAEVCPHTGLLLWTPAFN
jgi:tetratricopeptide (TPR) repeat protein